MTKHTAERRLARHVADQFHRGRIPAGLDRDTGALLPEEHRCKRQVPLQRLTAPRVHVPDGHPNLRVRVRGDVFHQKVNQAAVSLKDGQYLRCGRAGIHASRLAGL